MKHNKQNPNKRQVMQPEYTGAQMTVYTIWKNKYLHREPKVKVHKSVTRSILTYTAETRADITKTKQILDTAEMSVLRKTV
jgi:hypothetical protein